MNTPIFLLIAMFGLNDNIHNVWDNIDYDDVSISNADEFVDDMINHNKVRGLNTIPEINIYDDNVRKEYDGACVVLGWATNNSIYVYHFDSDKFVIV